MHSQPQGTRSGTQVAQQTSAARRLLPINLAQRTSTVSERSPARPFPHLPRYSSHRRGHLLKTDAPWWGAEEGQETQGPGD